MKDINKNTYVAIMAGGIGSRFWPASRTSLPKQFLDIMGVGKSLIRLTFERFLQLCPAENILIVTNGLYKDLVKEHLPEIGDHQILCEPSRNNTAPCVAYTALKLFDLNPDANLVIAPSDHIILQEGRFVEILQKALAFTAEHDALLTLGIEPSRPDTGYGYIEVGSGKWEVGSGKSEVGSGKSEVGSGKSEVGSDPPEAESPVPKVGVGSEEPSGGIFKVASFREKPDRATAQAYLESGKYLWNAGIFIWRVKSLLGAFRRHAAGIVDILQAEGVYNTPGEQAFIDENYPRTPSISIDYAIMEKADNVYTIPSSFGWSDLGTWASLHAESAQDAQGNVLQGKLIRAYDTHNSLVRAPADKLIVIGGLDDYIVVDERDVLLIWPKSREQEIKKVTGEIGEERFL